MKIGHLVKTVFRNANSAAAVILFLAICGNIRADKTHSLNKKANRLYDQGDYGKAIEIYNEALLDAPGDPRLKMNKGSTHYRLGEYDMAENSYDGALAVEDKRVRADLHYNRGNLFFRQGEQSLNHGDPQASRKFSAAVDEYIKALDIRPDDLDAKWNLQLAQVRLQQAQQQQQQQQDKSDNPDDTQKDKEQQDSGKQQENDQDQQNEKQQPQDQQQNDREKKPEQQPPPRTGEEQMKEEEAQRLIQQFSDDDEELNKPQRMMQHKGKQPEKDW